MHYYNYCAYLPNLLGGHAAWGDIPFPPPPLYETLIVLTCIVYTYCFAVSDDLDVELRLARYEELMDKRPFLLSRSAKNLQYLCLASCFCVMHKITVYMYMCLSSC